MTDNHNRTMGLSLLQSRTRLKRRMARSRGMDKDAFSKLFNQRAKLIAQQRSGDGDPETMATAIDAMTEALHGTAEADVRRTAVEDGAEPSTVDNLVEKYRENADEADRTQARIDGNSVKKRKGYVPHKFFGRWRIFKQQVGENGEPVLDAEGQPEWDHVAGEHGFWQTRGDAVRAASHMAKKDPSIKMRSVTPVEFVFPEDQATQLSDAALFRFKNNVSELLEVEGKELNDMIQGVARRRFRRRIAGFSQFRKGVKGYSQDLDRVMRTHIGEVVRYINLDAMKFEAINTMEKEGLSENRSSVQERPELAKFVQQWFKDLNGQKQDAERGIDAWLDKEWMSPLKGALATGGTVFAVTGGVVGVGGVAIGATTVTAGMVAMPTLMALYTGYRVGMGMSIEVAHSRPEPLRAACWGT